MRLKNLYTQVPDARLKRGHLLEMAQNGFAEHRKRMSNGIRFLLALPAHLVYTCSMKAAQKWILSFSAGLNRRML
jgi:hypothetical protein